MDATVGASDATVQIHAHVNNNPHIIIPTDVVHVDKSYETSDLSISSKDLKQDNILKYRA
jgi:hypothetical protein